MGSLVLQYFLCWALAFLSLPAVDMGYSRKVIKGDLDLTLGLGRSPGEGNGNPPQFSCLGNATVRGVWQVTVHGVAKSQT